MKKSFLKSLFTQFGNKGSAFLQVGIITAAVGSFSYFVANHSTMWMKSSKVKEARIEGQHLVDMVEGLFNDRTICINTLTKQGIDETVTQKDIPTIYYGSDPSETLDWFNPTGVGSNPGIVDGKFPNASIFSKYQGSGSVIITGLEYVKGSDNTPYLIVHMMKRRVKVLATPTPVAYQSGKGISGVAWAAPVKIRAHGQRFSKKIRLRVRWGAGTLGSRPIASCYSNNSDLNGDILKSICERVGIIDGDDRNQISGVAEYPFCDIIGMTTTSSQEGLTTNALDYFHIFTTTMTPYTFSNFTEQVSPNSTFVHGLALDAAGTITEKTPFCATSGDQGTHPFNGACIPVQGLCPYGQYMKGFDLDIDGNVVTYCADLNCPSTVEYVQNLNTDGSLNCRNILAASSCGVGPNGRQQYVSKINEDGTQECRELHPAQGNSCPTDQYLMGYNTNGSVNCFDFASAECDYRQYLYGFDASGNPLCRNIFDDGSSSKYISAEGGVFTIANGSIAFVADPPITPTPTVTCATKIGMLQLGGGCTGLTLNLGESCCTSPNPATTIGLIFTCTAQDTVKRTGTCGKEVNTCIPTYGCTSDSDCTTVATGSECIKPESLPTSDNTCTCGPTAGATTTGCAAGSPIRWVKRPSAAFNSYSTSSSFTVLMPNMILPYDWDYYYVCCKTNPFCSWF